MDFNAIHQRLTEINAPGLLSADTPRAADPEDKADKGRSGEPYILIDPSAAPEFLLAVRDDVDEDTVHMILETIYANLPFLQNIHKATNATALEKAIAGLPAPLHPGALKFYRDKGMKIPAHLIAK